MEQYISKSALVAEIERRISEVEQIDKASYEVGLLDAYKIILSFLNTLEVKEMDLNKEIETQWNKFVDSEGEVEQFSNIAKYFFELGLKAKGEMI